jgi:hypothetical protein
MGLDDRATPMGDAAYRVVVSADIMFDDPEFHPFVGVLATACGWRLVII